MPSAHYFNCVKGYSEKVQQEQPHYIDSIRQTWWHSLKSSQHYSQVQAQHRVLYPCNL